MKNSRTIHRQDYILHMLESSDSLSLKELAKELSVSEWTIRRDVNDLHTKGIIDRFHGGIRLKNHKRNELLCNNEALHMVEKNRIGIRAAKAIREGSRVIFGSGTTVRAVAKALARYEKKLTISTNSIEVCYELAHKLNYKITCTGGDVHGDFCTLDGPVTEKFLLSNYFDCAVIGPSAISIQHGLTIRSELSALTVPIMMEHSDHVIVVADHSKFGQSYQNKIGDLEAVDTIITDMMPPQEFCDFFGDHAIELLIA